jgi:hypothetical protein
LHIWAKDLFVEAMAARTHGADGYQAQHSKAVARRLTAMPEVLPVQLQQTLWGTGVKLCFDLAVADECNSNHKQCCANDPQPEEPTSPIHCSICRCHSTGSVTAAIIKSQL